MNEGVMGLLRASGAGEWAPDDADSVADMLAGIRSRGLRDTAGSADRRSRVRSSGAGDLEARRECLARLIGRLPPPEDTRLLMQASPTGRGPAWTRVDGGRACPVSWAVTPEYRAEGILVLPAGKIRADVVVLPDCDTPPETLFATGERRAPEAGLVQGLVARGCRVLALALLDRACTHSGIPGVRMTNQPHREFIYRAAFELGRHPIGYEAAAVHAAVSILLATPGAGGRPVGLIGYGEGGLVGLFAAALDPRIGVTALSGCFEPAEATWRRPIYRNVFRLLEAFGTAEIGALITDRVLLIEASRHPEVSGPPEAGPDRACCAAPGVVDTPRLEDVRREFGRLAECRDTAMPEDALRLLVSGPDGSGVPGGGGLLRAFAEALGLRPDPPERDGSGCPSAGPVAPRDRERRLVEGMVRLNERFIAEAEFSRSRRLPPAGACHWATVPALRESAAGILQNDVIGRLHVGSGEPRVRVRPVGEVELFATYEVRIDICEDIFAYGLLLVPRGVRADEARPAVVCQHGLEGTPRDTVEDGPESGAYNRFSARLAEEGFVVYAPQNPYIGRDRFRVLQRILNPLGMSLFSVIIEQHRALLAWLRRVPFIDPERIGFYGISYGGKTAMRVPALLPEYAAVICSADFNEWVWKNTSYRHAYSYLLTGEYEMPEFNLANTLSYAEMAGLIYPRPFMVERGHHDGVAPDEWVAYEYAKVFRLYSLTGLADRTEMEVFDGPHAIRGQGTFRFLKRHLGPVPPAAPKERPATVSPGQPRR